MFHLIRLTRKLSRVRKSFHEFAKFDSNEVSRNISSGKLIAQLSK